MFSGVEIFGAYILGLSIFVILTYRNKLYAITVVFILSFYEIINLIRVIVVYSIIIAEWNNGFNITIPTDSEITTIKALIITCLVCACLGFILMLSIMDIIRAECQFQSRRTSSQGDQMTTVAFSNPVVIVPSN